MRASLIAAAIAAAACCAASVEATPITYTFTGVFDGTFNGTDFSDTPVTFTGTGDTSAISSNGYSYYQQLSSLTAQAIGATFDVIEPTYFYINPNGYAGLEFGAFDDTSYFSGQNNSLIGYNGASSVASTPFESTSFDYGQTAAVVTQFGAVNLSGETNGIFSASVVSAAPEPGTWMMMILGFGLVGGVLRSAYRKSEDRFTNQVRTIAAA